MTKIVRDSSIRGGRSAWAVCVAACLMAASGALQIAIAQTPGGASPASRALGPMFSLAPLAGDVISQFGPRTDPNRGGPQFHTGVDFGAPEGAAVVAPAAGRVTRVGSYPSGWGNLLEIDHGGGLVTRYAHLSAFEVREGQQVAAGQLIARVGSTGRSTLPHLHFAVSRDGREIDPESVLPRRRTD